MASERARSVLAGKRCLPPINPSHHRNTARGCPHTISICDSPRPPLLSRDRDDQPYVPPTKPYELSALAADLVVLARYLLTPGGRRVRAVSKASLRHTPTSHVFASSSRSVNRRL